jgi:hypothetical protein
LGTVHGVFDSCDPWPMESISRLLWIWVILATMFTRHESLRLFFLVLPQRLCIPHQPSHCSRLAN